MKLKLLLLLIASCISNLNASFTLADITTPAKACTDVTCILAKHPGGIAATGFAVGSLMYVHADREYRKAHEASEKLGKLRKATESNAPLFGDDYKDRSEQLKKAIKEYEEAQAQLNNIEKNTVGSVRARVTFKTTAYKSLPRNFSAPLLKQAQTEAEEAEKELKEKEASPELHNAKERLEKSKAALATSFDEEFKSLNIQALQKYYTNLCHLGACIAIASAAGYGIYKAYPQLKKWFAAYVR